MPRKSNRGGTREGTPGKKYANRTDLRTPKPKLVKLPSQVYGQQAQQVAAQQAVPVSRAPTDATGTVAPGGVQAPPSILPGSFGPLDRPTEFPDEPLTSGIDSGPGPGSEALNYSKGIEDELRAMYQMNPNEDLRELIEEMEEGY